MVFRRTGISLLLHFQTFLTARDVAGSSPGCSRFAQREALVPWDGRIFDATCDRS